MKLKIDELSKFLLVAIVVLLYFLPNGTYLFVPAAISLTILYFLQQSYKPAIFSLLIIWHFLQIVTGAILCNYLGKDIDYNTPYRSTAILASSIGLIPLIFSIVRVQNKFPNQNFSSLKESVKDFSFQKVIYAYVASFFGYIFLGGIAFNFSGLTQFLFWIASIKWILFSLLGYMCFLQNKKKRLFYVFVLLEFVAGFYSFFSEFKAVIFFVFILLLSLVEKIDITLFVKTLITITVLLFFGILWTNIKGEYRTFLNGGKKSQEVTVNSDEALNKIYELSNDVDRSSFEGSITDFLGRLQYTYFFSKTIERVPEIIPFRKGRNWLDNIEFTTTPRFLNPNKPILDQTEKTKTYTGIKMAGLNKGTSFSLGYFAECYIDFGLKGMMILLFLIGLMYSYFYNFLLRKASNSLVFNYCVAGAFFMEFTEYALDGTYLLGRFLAGVVTFYFLVKFVFPTIIKYLTITERED